MYSTRTFVLNAQQNYSDAPSSNYNLIDEYQFMIDPVAIPDGTPVFANIKPKLDLQLTGSKVFNSGVVLLNYKPTKRQDKGE
ncbi:MAG: hypothetical protein FOGNACKC_00333 [Anaerolineae bacterium]|nr:hypothetical protein [Anaerolineae bacterium]